MTRSAASVTIAAVFALAACGDDFRSAGELNNSPQILSVRADPPAVNPGETVRLDALVHWPDALPALVWLICIPDVGDDLTSCLTGSFTGGQDPPLCGADPGAKLCIANLGDVADYTVPPDAFPDDGEQHTFFVNVLATPGFEGLEGCQDALSSATPSESCLLALKRVVVTYEEQTNINPQVSGLLVNGVTVDPSQPAVVIAPGDLAEKQKVWVHLAVEVDPASVDELQPSEGDPAAFDLIVSWFATCGSVSREKDYLRCDPPAAGQEGPGTCEPSGTVWQPETLGECEVHAVVRDGAGGVGFRSQTVILQ